MATEKTNGNSPLEDEFLKNLLEAFAEMKPMDPVVVDLRELCSFAEYFVIATASSVTHASSIAEETITKVKKSCKRHPIGSEGIKEGGWTLLDYGEIIVHIFSEEQREYYKLENLWKNAPRVELPESLKLAASSPKPTISLESSDNEGQKEVEKRVMRIRRIQPEEK